MEEEILLEYSDNESDLFEDKTYHTSNTTYVPKVVLVEEHIRSLENLNSFCKICNAELKSLVHAKTHCKSDNHLQKTEIYRQKLLLLPIETLREMANTEFYGVACSVFSEDEFKPFCKICNIAVNEPGDFHYISEEHKRNLECYCNICEMKVISKEDLLTHKFITHGNRSQLHQDGPFIPKVYVTPKISPKKKIDKNSFPLDALDQLKIQFAPEIVGAFSVTKDKRIYCSFCNVKLQSLNCVKTHVKGKKHVKKVEKKDLFVKEDIINTKKNCFGDENNNANQETSTNNNINTLAVEEAKKSTKQKIFYCYVCNMEFDSKEKLNVHKWSFPHTELAKFKSELMSSGVYQKYWTQSDNSYCCILCNAIIYEVNVWHCNSTKHMKLLTEWCKEQRSFSLLWDPPDELKYFYCKTCEVSLDGTSDDELHYVGLLHLRSLERYCHICNVTVTTELFDNHQRSLTHQENVFVKEMEGTFITLRDSNETGNRENCEKDKNSLELPSDTSVKQKIFVELRKLVHMLYYSKTIPCSEALNYLKKFNKEISELQQKYQPKPGSSSKFSESSMEHKNCGTYLAKDVPPSTFSKSSLNHDWAAENWETDTTNEIFSEMQVDNQNISDKKGVPSCTFSKSSIKHDEAAENRVTDTTKEIFSEMQVDNQNISDNKGVPPSKCDMEDNGWIGSSGIGINDIKELSLPKKKKKRNKKKENTLESVVKDTHPNDEGLQVTIEDKLDKSVIENEDRQKVTNKENRPNEENKFKFENTTNLKDMMEVIKFKRNEMVTLCGPLTYYNGEEEVELLREIETLIELIDSGDIPPDIILSYLQECTKEIECLVEEEDKKD